VEYKQAIDNVKDLFERFEIKILTKYKEAYWYADPVNLKKYLRIISRYDIMNRVAEHYIE